MILSKEGIQEALRNGHLAITPEPREDQYTTSAVDLTLGDDFKRWDDALMTTPGLRAELNLAEQDFLKTARHYTRPVGPDREGSIVLPPYFKEHWHLLAITRERVCLNREGALAARVEGRSSLARLGLIVHLTAPIIHAGWVGVITLEIINFGPFYLKLVPHQTRICQLIFERLEMPAVGEPATAFQGQVAPTGEGPH